MGAATMTRCPACAGVGWDDEVHRALVVRVRCRYCRGVGRLSDDQARVLRREADAFGAAVGDLLGPATVPTPRGEV